MQIKWAENAREKQKSQGLFRMVRSKPLVGYRTAQSDKAGRKVNAILYGRKLYKDGDWNTLCLPFALTAEQIATGDLAGAIIKELDTEGKYKIDNGQWIMDNEAGTQQTGFDA